MQTVFVLTIAGTEPEDRPDYDDVLTAPTVCLSRAAAERVAQGHADTVARDNECEPEALLWHENRQDDTSGRPFWAAFDGHTGLAYRITECPVVQA